MAPGRHSRSGPITPVEIWNKETISRAAGSCPTCPSMPLIQSVRPWPAASLTPPTAVPASSGWKIIDLRLFHRRLIPPSPPGRRRLQRPCVYLAFRSVYLGLRCRSGTAKSRGAAVLVLPVHLVGSDYRRGDHCNLSHAILVTRSPILNRNSPPKRLSGHQPRLLPRP
ncbi:hypothetical protein SCARD494_11127 [Seiridium cardinale]